MYSSTILAASFVALAAALPKEACYHPNGCQGGGNWQGGAGVGVGVGAGAYGSGGVGGQWQGGVGGGQWQGNVPQGSGWRGAGQWQGVPQGGNWQQGGQWQGNVPQGGNWQQGGQWQGGVGGGQFQGGVGGGQQQFPLQFGGAGNQQVQIGQLTPCDYTTTQISFPAHIEIEIDINQITCQAFTDADGHNQIGNSFGYDQTCDFDGPTQVRSILCTLS